jgi:hypothetical protein
MLFEERDECRDCGRLFPVYRATAEGEDCGWADTCKPCVAAAFGETL